MQAALQATRETCILIQRERERERKTEREREREREEGGRGPRHIWLRSEVLIKNDGNAIFHGNVNRVVPD